MTRDESIALWRQGKDAWNAWANEMLARRKALEDMGAWKVDEHGRAQNDATREWMEAASVDFSGLCFVTHALAEAVVKQAGDQKEGSQTGDGAAKTISVEGDEIDFDGFVFLRGADFGDTKFYGNVAFGDAQFHGWAWFRDAQFHREAGFWRAQFYGLAGFEDAQFHGAAELEATRFHGLVGFWRAQFHGLAQFGDAQFHGRALFGDAQFHGKARFVDAQFYGDAAFTDVTFKASTSFRKAAFRAKKNQQDADFTGIKVERAFDLTKASFSKVPAFNQADFAQAPDLDNVRYPFPPFFRFWVRGWEDEEKTVRRAEKFKADAAKYRHLRRLAILGHDHENESKAFKGETRAKRGTEHKPWLAAFWFGVGYDALSDFGRSMMRPFHAWAMLTAAFAAFYLWTSDAPSLASCAPSAKDLAANVTALGEAAYLAIKNGLIVIGLGSEGKINQAHACLYGGSVSAPNFPSGISIWQIVQNFLSAPLIFLFLLGVRNQFKIK